MQVPQQLGGGASRPAGNAAPRVWLEHQPLAVPLQASRAQHRHQDRRTLSWRYSGSAERVRAAPAGTRPARGAKKTRLIDLQRGRSSLVRPSASPTPSAAVPHGPEASWLAGPRDSPSRALPLGHDAGGERRRRHQHAPRSGAGGSRSRPPSRDGGRRRSWRSNSARQSVTRPVGRRVGTSSRTTKRRRSSATATVRRCRYR